MLGVIERELGRHDRAIELICKAISIKSVPRYHYDLGNVYYLKGDYAGAIGCFQNAVGLAPDFAAAHVGLGNSLFQLGEIDRAVAAYRCAWRFARTSSEPIQTWAWH